MTYGVVRAFQVIVNTLQLSPEKAALSPWAMPRTLRGSLDQPVLRDQRGTG